MVCILEKAGGQIGRMEKKNRWRIPAVEGRGEVHALARCFEVGNCLLQSFNERDARFPI